MFILNEFIMNNLIKCVENGAFSKEQAGIFALNYFNKGQITEEEFQALAEEFTKETEAAEEDEM